MHRLSPRQIENVAGLICGGGNSPTDYRRMVDIEGFVRFSGAEVGEFGYGMSRLEYARAFLEAAQAVGVEGPSSLGREVEKILGALLDLREFSSEDQRSDALVNVNQILTGIPVEVRVGRDGSVQIASTATTRSQQVLDEQIHTVFGQVLADSELRAARTHYAKAKRFLEAADPDHENAAKEAVSSLESLVVTLTGERDYVKAIKKATDAELIPRPIDEIAIKLFAYRGNEPGVAHGSAKPPNVTPDEALLIFNLAAALGGYLATALREP